MIEHIEQQWLKSFHCVYENNSFKRAAEFLNLPTSNVSRHIALLEEKLNTRLFERTTRRMAPTDAGEQLYASTQPLLGELNDALEEVTRHSHKVMGAAQSSYARYSTIGSSCGLFLYRASFNIVMLRYEFKSKRRFARWI